MLKSNEKEETTDDLEQVLKQLKILITAINASTEIPLEINKCKKNCKELLRLAGELNDATKP